MSATYSRTSWPYKNIVISFFFFNSPLSVCRDAEMEDERRGMTGLDVSVRGWVDGGWMDEGKPNGDRLSLSVPAEVTTSAPQWMLRFLK